MTLAHGTRLGPYEITDRIGAGGMGEVWRAKDTRLDRIVAIKILPSHFEANANLKERFAREAKTISQLNHPHICVLYDVGESDVPSSEFRAPSLSTSELGTWNSEHLSYLVMEYLEGESLSDRLRRGPLPLDEVLRYGIQIASALAAAHRQGIIHRDLKPGNVMLTKSGAKLLDFGLAKSVVVEVSTDAATAHKPLTREGTILGTFQYMAPEQLEGLDADARTDIFALGCLLYEMATGKRAFDGTSKTSLIAAIVSAQPQPISTVQPMTPPALEHVVRKCLEKQPDNRWQSAQDVASELQWISESRASASPSGNRVFSRATIAAIAVLAIALSVAIWKGKDSGPARNPVPVVVLMDSTHPLRVYDDETRRRGGTNADDLSDLLNDSGFVLLKENTSWTWHREDEVLRQSPDLILVHRSCFYVPSGMENNAFENDFYARASDKLEIFLGYIALGNPRTKFLVYSRGSWKTEDARRQWIAAIERRFPAMKGRVMAWQVPLDRATFRHPQTGSEIKQAAQRLLETE